MDNNGLGKKILIGIRYYNLKDELVEQFQTSGIIDSITSDEIRIKRENKKELFIIPNDDRAIIKAKPGKYRERESGKVIINPDFISQWAIQGNGSEENLKEYKEFGFPIGKENT